MGDRKAKQLKTTLTIYRVVVLVIGAALFTVAAVFRYQRQEYFQDRSLLYLAAIAVIWIFEAICALLQIILLPNVREAKIRSHDNAPGKRPYDFFLVALRCLEENDHDGALDALTRIDFDCLEGTPYKRYTALWDLAQEPERDTVALAMLYEMVNRDIDRMERRHRLLGSLPRAAILTLVLLFIMTRDVPEYPARSTQLQSNITVQNTQKQDTYCLEIKTEASPANSADEYAIHMLYQSFTDGELSLEGDNDFFIQSPAPGGVEGERIVYIPSRMQNPAEYSVIFPDTAGFDNLDKALTKAIKREAGQATELDGVSCLVFRSYVQASKVSDLLSFQLNLFSAGPYTKAQAWKNGLGSADTVEEQLGANWLLELPVTVWTDEGGNILQAEIDTTPIISALLSGLGLSYEADSCSLSLSYANYDPSWISPPEAN